MGASETKKRPEKLTHIKALCPLTGMTFGTKRIEPHFTIATPCKNGTVHIYCLLHMFRGFIKHPQILEMLDAKGRKAEVARSIPVRSV